MKNRMIAAAKDKYAASVAGRAGLKPKLVNKAKEMDETPDVENLQEEAAEAKPKK